jgi:alpha-L-rhamnosidase
VGEWLYRFVAGIDLSADHLQAAGFAHFDLRPYPDNRIGFVEASFLSPFGEIRSEWRLSEDDLLTFAVTVPAGTTATVYVPAVTPESVREHGEPAADSEGLRFLRWEEGRAIYHALSGRYQFRSRMPRPLIGKTGC